MGGQHLPVSQTLPDFWIAMAASLGIKPENRAIIEKIGKKAKTVVASVFNADLSPTSVAIDEIGHVLKDDELGFKGPDNFHGREEKSAAASLKAASRSVPLGISHDADVLARAAKGDTADRRELEPFPVKYVFKLRCVRKSVTKHSPVNVIQLDLPESAPAGLLETKPEAGDSSKKFSEGKVVIHLKWFVLIRACAGGNYYQFFHPLAVTARAILRTRLPAFDASAGTHRVVAVSSLVAQIIDPRLKRHD